MDPKPLGAKMRSMFYARLGATFYVLWGLLHLYVTYDVFRFAKGVEPLAARAPRSAGPPTSDLPRLR
jgi:hypothetical protein